jgi:lysophospholipase L1-like esterase
MLLYLLLPLLTMLPFQSKPRHILALGDSYTIGESVAEEERWPNHLQRLLHAEGIECAAPLIVAKTGWTTDELEKGIEQASLADQYDLVTLLIGVNNQYRGRDSEQYRLELRKLIEFAIKKANGKPNRVILLSIPDWGVTPFAKGRDHVKIASQIDQYNQVKQEEAERAKVHFVAITDITRDISGTKVDLIATDGLHPSGKMYLEWAKRVLPIAKESLKN